MEENILSMYVKGMTTGDIESHMKELYDMNISDNTISRITDKILPIVKEWQVLLTCLKIFSVFKDNNYPVTLNPYIHKLCHIYFHNKFRLSNTFNPKIIPQFFANFLHSPTPFSRTEKATKGI